MNPTSPTPINFKAMQPQGRVSPAVITSRAARKDLNKIQVQHADLVRSIAEQKTRVDALNQQRAAEMQNQNVMKQEMEKEKMTANTANRQMDLDYSMKTAELDIKRAALAAK